MVVAVGASGGGTLGAVTAGVAGVFVALAAAPFSNSSPNSSISACSNELIGRGLMAGGAAGFGALDELRLRDLRDGGAASAGKPEGT